MQILEIKNNDFEEIYSLVRTTFPKEECYPYDYHYKALMRPSFFGRKLVLDNKIKAFVTGFQQKNYLFLDYFAVDKNLRGQGIGGKFLKKVIESVQCPVILEVELPETEMAKRRIVFYERLGFQLNTYPYRMPLIAEGFGDTPLYIMSYPLALAKKEFDILSQDIYCHVYQTKGD